MDYLERGLCTTIVLCNQGDGNVPGVPESMHNDIGICAMGAVSEIPVPVTDRRGIGNEGDLRARTGVWIAYSK